MAWLMLSIIICCFIGIDSVAMIAGHSRIGGPSSPLQKLCVTESCIAAAHNLFNVSFTFKDNLVLVLNKLQHYMFGIKYILFKIIWDIPLPRKYFLSHFMNRWCIIACLLCYCCILDDRWNGQSTHNKNVPKMHNFS